jgi:hypothetical protein
MSILDKFLKKIGENSYEDLTSEEKDTYRAWELSLAGRKITEEEYRTFLLQELDTAVTRLIDVDLKVEDAIFRKVEVRMIKKIISFLDMPKMEKQLIEKQIQSQL